MDDPLIPTRAFHGVRAVLVVDDVRAVRQLTSRLLSEEGYRVFEAAGAIEALEVLELARGRIDVVLMDVVMPDVTGVDLTRLIREKWPDQRVVFMSAHPAQVLVQEGLRDLNVLFLAKPFTRGELTAVLGRAIAGPRRVSGGQSRVRPPNEP